MFKLSGAPVADPFVNETHPGTSRSMPVQCCSGQSVDQVGGPSALVAVYRTYKAKWPSGKLVRTK